MRRVSDLLKEKREEKKLTLKEIEGETKIKKEFLELIEEGNFQALPSESYALGFVKNYAKYLLKEGTMLEKRELLSNLKSKLLFKDKKVYLEK